MTRVFILNLTERDNRFGGVYSSKKHLWDALVAEFGSALELMEIEGSRSGKRPSKCTYPALCRILSNPASRGVWAELNGDRKFGAFESPVNRLPPIESP